MLLNQLNEKTTTNVLINGKYFSVGDTVIGNKTTVFDRYIGKITDIKFSDCGPEIYVEFGNGQVIMESSMLM